MLLRARPASGTAPASLDFSSAEAVANGSARSYDSGTFARLMLAQAVHGSATVTLPITGSGGPASCSLGLVAGSSVTLTASDGSPGSGQASFWEFLYQANHSNLLTVVVNGQQAVAAFTLNGTGCGDVYAGWKPVPSGVITSSTAASVADADGGTAFLKAHPTATGLFVISNGLSIGSGPVWSVDYTTCPESQLGGENGSLFSAAVNATNGGVISSATSTVSCQAFYPFGTAPQIGVPIATVLALGASSPLLNTSAPKVCTSRGGASDTCYAFPIVKAGTGLRAQALAFAIRDSLGNPVSFTHGSPDVRIEAASGASLGAYTFSAGQWTSGGTTGLSSTQALVLDLGCTTSGIYACSPSPTGLYLVVLGAESYTGEFEVALG